MAPLVYLSIRKVLLLYLVLFLFSSLLIDACSETEQPQKRQILGRKRLFQVVEEEEEIIQLQPKKKTNTNSNSNSNTLSPKKNQTKLIKPKTNSTKPTLTSDNLLTNTQFKKLNSTPKKSSNSTKSTPTLSTKIQLKKLNSTSKSSNSTSKSSDLLKSISPKNKTTKPIITKQSDNKKITIDKLESKNPDKTQLKEKKPKSQKTQTPSTPNWLAQEDESDLVAEFRDLPAKFQETLLPDLEKISTTSKIYLNKANKEITKGFKPIVGTKYAPTIATITSFTFILLPLLLVSLIINHFKAYFSLQKILIFIQVYLSIYFSILCLSSLVTGLEPLRFFYATSQSTYVCVQVLQTLAYVLYLLLLLMYLVLVFSTDCGLGPRMLGLGQTFVGYAVGLHYYVSVFHRVVLHQPPKTNWKIHGIYATCFLVICLFARAERGKKAYLEDGGEEGKKN